MKIIGYIGITAVIIFLLRFHVVAVPNYREWGIFHYYLGAKYVKEIGYFDIYSCALETKHDVWTKTTMIRDLHSYDFVPVKAITSCPKQKFSQKRWEEFQKDVAFITKIQPKTYWAAVLTDKGFNPPPFWAAMTGMVAQTIPIENEFLYTILFNLDLLFVVLGAGLVGYSAGRFAGILTLLLSLVYFGTFGILGNNFFQYVWYPLLVASVVAWRKNHYSLSGIALGIATGLQAFPLFFALPVVLSFIFSWIRKKTIQFNASRMFLLSFCIMLFICFIGGVLYTGKMTIWTQWYEKIAIHKRYITGEIFDIGLPNALVVSFAPDQMVSQDYMQAHTDTKRRSEIFIQYPQIEYVLGIVCILVLICLIWRLHQFQPVVLGIIPLYMLTTLSPYYYLFLALIPFFFWEHGRYVKAFSVYGICGIFLFHFLLFTLPMYVSFAFMQHFVSELSIFLFFSILVGLLLLSKTAKK